MHFPMNFHSYPSLSFAHNPLSFSYSLMSVPTCVATCNTSPVSNITSLSHSTMNNHQEVSPSSPHPQPPMDANANIPSFFNNVSTSTETTSTPENDRLDKLSTEKSILPLCSEEYVRKFILSGRKSNNMGWECVHFIDVPELICMIAQIVITSPVCQLQLTSQRRWKRLLTMAIPLMKLMKLKLRKLCSIPLSMGVNAQLLLT